MRTISKRAVQTFFRRLQEDGHIELAEGTLDTVCEAFRELIAERRHPLDGERFAAWLLEQDEVEDVFAEDHTLRMELSRLGEAPPKRVATSVVAKSDELEAAIIAAPDRAEGYLVYGDWLQEQGDALGTLIVLGARAEAGDAEASKQFTRWLKKYGLLGRIASYVPKTIELQWRRGLVHSLRAGTPSGRGSYETTVMTELALDLRVCRFVQELTVCPFRQREDGSGVLDAIAEARLPVLHTVRLQGFHRIDSLARLQRLPRLRTLEIDMRGRGISTLDALPSSIESLSIDAGELQIPDRELALPRVRHLVLTNADPAPVAAWLCHGHFPALTELELDGVAREGAPALTNLGIDELTDWLTRDDAPRLSALSLRRTEDTASFVAKLAQSRWAAGLRSLSLADGDLRGPELRKLAPLFADRFAGLTELDLRGNAIMPADAELLARPDLTLHFDTPTIPDAPTPGRIRTLAATTACQARAEKIARPESWTELGRDAQQRWWGRYGGTSPYRVWLRADLQAWGCSCPSHDSPCKHIVALAMLAAEQSFAEAAIPSGFVRRERYDETYE